ncbi:hypothetical protein [Halorussus amylolyticus]|uniref:hypothetical protein n=1 Tax=Halorussus amylolyticus TaxID=1126242 RepID=UPI0010429512|nr:hypothetical protein [Halorussus amylolyticus]
MRRRDTLRKCVGVVTVGGLGALAGCTGGGDADDGGEANLAVEGFDHGADDSGELVVTVTVENDGDAEGSGTLYVEVEAGEDITRESQEVTVAPGGSETYDLKFPFDYERFRDQGSISLDLRT